MRKRRDTETKKREKQQRIIKRAIKGLLKDFDKIYGKHEELGDTAVRDKMFEVVEKFFLRPLKGYALPTSFGMFSDAGNTAVRTALEKFLQHPEVKTAKKELKTPDDRLFAFQDFDIQTKEGTTIFEFFGYRNKLGAK